MKKSQATLKATAWLMLLGWFMLPSTEAEACKKPATSPAVRCKVGTYNIRTRRCRIPRRRCPYGYYYDYYQRHCIKRCGSGYRWNGRFCVLVTLNCPYGWVRSGNRCIRRCSRAWRWNGYRCVPRCSRGWWWNGRRCIWRRVCAYGWIYNRYLGRCVRRCARSWWWDGHRCRPRRRCGLGYYWSHLHRRCIRTKCPTGYVRTPGSLRCVRKCPAGQTRKNGVCKPNHKRCGEGFFFSHYKQRCVNRCRSGEYWDHKKKTCKRVSW